MNKIDYEIRKREFLLKNKITDYQRMMASMVVLFISLLSVTIAMIQYNAFLSFLFSVSAFITVVFIFYRINELKESLKAEEGEIEKLYNKAIKLLTPRNKRKM